MVVEDRDVRADCTCGQWSTEVDWDGIDTMVIRIREHLGSEDATSDDGIPRRRRQGSPSGEPAEKLISRRPSADPGVGPT